MTTTGVISRPPQGLGVAGQTAEARIAIDKALERADANEERWCMPELLRIKGELLRLDGSADSSEAAEDYFHQSLAEARRQQALSWKLRAATPAAASTPLGPSPTL